MAEKMEDTTVDQEETADDKKVGKSKKSGLMKVVKALAFISVIVLLEVAAASMLVPSASETIATAERLAATDGND